VDKNECEQKCDKLFREAQECQRHKEEVANNLQLNKMRLIRATKLLSGLKDEKERWKEDVQEFKKNTVFIAGDCVIASGMLSYAGPFETTFRHKLTQEWIRNLQSLNIRISDSPSLKHIAGNEVEIENWKAN